MRRIAIIGNIYGNLYNLYKKEPLDLLWELEAQIKSSNMEISSIEFIKATSSINNIFNSSKGNIFLWDFDEKVIVKQKTKLLEELHSESMEVDKLIGRKIRNEEINGLILINSDPIGINMYSIEAAIEKNIPIIGTGDTSMAIISTMGENVIEISETSLDSLVSNFKYFR